MSLLVASVSGLCVSLADRYAGPGNPHRDEIRSAAALGAVRAALKFDPGRGLKFTTLAQRCIICAIIDELRRLTKHEAPGSLEDPGEVSETVRPVTLAETIEVLKPPRIYQRILRDKNPGRSAKILLGKGGERLLQCSLRKMKKLADSSSNPEIMRETG